jgi:hypothetical protein
MILIGFLQNLLKPFFEKNGPKSKYNDPKSKYNVKCRAARIPAG